MNLFSIEWQKRIEIFNIEIEKALEDLRNKHEKQIVLFALFRTMYKLKSKTKRSSTRAPNCCNSARSSNNWGDSRTTLRPIVSS
jgi:hypothetical protein